MTRDVTGTRHNDHLILVLLAYRLTSFPEKLYRMVPCTTDGQTTLGNERTKDLLGITCLCHFTVPRYKSRVSSGIGLLDSERLLQLRFMNVVLFMKGQSLQR